MASGLLECRQRVAVEFDSRIPARENSLAFLDFFFYRVAATTGFLLLLAVPLGGLVWPSLTGWLLVILAGTVDVVISRALYYLALRRLDMSLHTILLTLSPVVTMGWSLVLWGSRPSVQELLGGLGILAGVLLVTASRAGLTRAPRL